MLTGNDEKHILELLKRVELGTATPAEIHFIDTYFNYLDEANQALTPFSSKAEKTALGEEMKAGLLQEIREDNTTAPVLPIRRKPVWRWVAAAAIMVAAGISTYLAVTDRNQHKAVVAAVTEEAPVSHDRAILKLANGQELQLDSVKGNIVQQKEFIINNDSGTLHYNSKATTPEYHTLYTPNGAQFQLQLPDGTNVWLNTASSITYPTIFTGNNRDVTITGEAYFEVARNKSMPFRVKANDMQIEVTGTRFNVNTYTNEPFLTTTLLEGGVKVTRNNSTVQLTPGQQSVSGADGRISTSNQVNTDEVMAWKNGYFQFESASLSTILRQVSRWYNVDIVYDGNIPDEKYFIIIKRTSSLQTLLKALQATNVEFSIEGKKLTVKAIQ